MHKKHIRKSDHSCGCCKVAKSFVSASAFFIYAGFHRELLKQAGEDIANCQLPVAN
jgi:hypothetical protein